MRGKRTDANQVAIVEALRNSGCEVKVCSSFGAGFPDLIARGPAGTRFIEVKMPGERGSLTRDQREFFGAYFDVYIVCNEAEALAVMGCEYPIWSKE